MAESMSAEDATPSAVLDFWFSGDLDRRAGLDTAVERWFRPDPAFDAAIRNRFGPLANTALAGELGHWRDQPRSWLALLIVLDQFPRNIHRGTPAAFAGDTRAQHEALAGIDRGFDRELAPMQRSFAYLPLEHAEDLSLQQRSVLLFEALADQAPEALRPVFDVFLDYARQHRDVIARFGRFPHRNRIMDRSSTPEELDYLKTPGAGF